MKIHNIKTEQMTLLSAQKMNESTRIIAQDYREAAAKDKSSNFNLFFSHKFDGENQVDIFENSK